MEFFWVLVLAGVAWGVWSWNRNAAAKLRNAYEASSERRAFDDRGADDQRDAWEGTFWEVERAVNMQRAVRLNYVDGSGVATARDVDIRAFEPKNPKGLVIGHCRLRDATRTFRYDRVRQCVDLDTGEVVADLRQHLCDLHGLTPVGTVDRIAETNRDLLMILLYVAKADGQMRAAEVDVIAELCRTVSGKADVSPSAVRAFLQTVDVMTPLGFEAACKRLSAEDAPQYDQCIEAATRIVATQKTVHPNEKAALEVMQLARATHEVRP